MSNRKKLKGTLIDHSERRDNRIERIKNTFVGRYNGYICNECKLGYLTLDIDPGTTPMFGPCFATPGCKGRAHSMGYPTGEPPISLGEPIIYWIKPSGKAFDKLSPEMKVHVMQGGLIRKATESAADWVKEML